MAGKTCREIVEARGHAGSAYRGGAHAIQVGRVYPLAVAVVDGDVEALEWLIQLFDRKGPMWRPVGEKLSYLAAKRGKIEQLMWRPVGDERPRTAAKRGEATWRCWRALGARDRVPVERESTGWAQQREATWRCCQRARQGGCAWDAERRVRGRRREGEATWRCSSGSHENGVDDFAGYVSVSAMEA